MLAKAESQGIIRNQFIQATEAGPDCGILSKAISTMTSFVNDICKHIVAFWSKTESVVTYDKLPDIISPICLCIHHSHVCRVSTNQRDINARL